MELIIGFRRLRSMMLINSLLAHATDARWEEFIGELHRLNVRKAVIVSVAYRFSNAFISLNNV